MEELERNKKARTRLSEKIGSLPFVRILLLVYFALTVLFLAWYVLYVYLIASFPYDTIDGPKFLYGTIFFQDPGDYFMDFFNVNFMVSDRNPYYVEGDVGGGSSYPPLILAIAFFFQLISGTAESGKELRLTTGGIVSGVIYQALVLGLLCASLFVWRKKNGIPLLDGILLCVSLCCSAPFLFLFDRGNYLMVALVFVAVFFLLRKEEKAWKREIALVSLACAVGCKLYPAVFVFLLLREKRIREFLRALLYCVALGFLPFLFFKNGFSNVVYFLQNLSRFSSETYTFYVDGVLYSTGYSNDVSVANLANVVSMWLGNFSCFDLSESVSLVGRILTILFAVVTIGGIFLAKREEDALLFACSAIVLLPSPSFVYTNTFLVFPFLAFLKNSKRDAGSVAMFILFLCVFLPVDLGYLLQKWSHGLQHGYAVANFVQCLAIVATCLYRFAVALNDRFGESHDQRQTSVS